MSWICGFERASAIACEKQSIPEKTPKTGARRAYKVRFLMSKSAVEYQRGKPNLRYSGDGRLAIGVAVYGDDEFVRQATKNFSLLQ